MVQTPASVAEPPSGSTRITRLDRTLQHLSSFRDADGAQLDARPAAVELLNVLRPTVAVAELGRFYPMAPFVGASSHSFIACIPRRR